MSGFVAAPTPAPAAIDDTIAGDGWWPEVSIKSFRDAVRLSALATDGRARDALVSAMIAVASELAGWRATREAEGRATLADVPGPIFGGEPRAVLLWRRAVYSTAAADLADTQNDIAATDTGRTRNELEGVSAADHRRNATVAIRLLTDTTPTRVRII